MATSSNATRQLSFRVSRARYSGESKLLSEKGSCLLLSSIGLDGLVLSMEEYPLTADAVESVQASTPLMGTTGPAHAQKRPFLGRLTPFLPDDAADQRDQVRLRPLPEDDQVCVTSGAFNDSPQSDLVDPNTRQLIARHPVRGRGACGGKIVQ